MATRLVDEREHRRGLILGLTLAEVLLLLLFLIMLALSIPLQEYYDSTHLAQDEASALRAENDRLKKLLAQRPSSDVLQNSEAVRKIDKLFSKAGIKGAQLDEFLASIKPLVADSSRLTVLEQFLKAAITIDPNDPPATLRRATAAIAIIGKDIKPEQLTSSLAPVVKDAKSLSRFDSVYKDAAKINPDDPPAALKPVDDATRNYLPLAGTLANLPTLPKDPGEAEKRIREGLDALSRGEHNWPPIIILGDDRYRFKILSAEVTGRFEANLRENVVPELLRYVQDYQVDTIEVIGHTDEQVITQPRNSNLDLSLLDFLRKGGSASALNPADNAGLGMARAVAVARLLMNDHRLAPYRDKILPLSGAQLIGTDDKITKGIHGDIKERRRERFGFVALNNGVLLLWLDSNGGREIYPGRRNAQDDPDKMYRRARPSTMMMTPRTKNTTAIMAESFPERVST